MLIACSAIALPANAHKTSLAYLNLDVTENKVDASLVVAIADMAVSINRTIPSTGAIPTTLATDIEAYIDRNLHLSIAKGVPCTADANSFGIDLKVDTMEVQRHYACPGPVETLSIVYNVFFNDDPTSRAIITAQGPMGKREAMAELSSRTLNLRLVGQDETANRPSFL